MYERIWFGKKGLLGIKSYAFTLLGQKRSV